VKAWAGWRVMGARDGCRSRKQTEFAGYEDGYGEIAAGSKGRVFRSDFALRSASRPLGSGDTTMTNFAMKVLACGIWWLSAICVQRAVTETNGNIAVIALAAAILLAGSGLGLWRGSSSESGPDAAALRRSALRAEVRAE
jgi:hypothetical protein